MFNRGTYPTPEGFVKCVYCRELRLGVGGVLECRVTGGRMYGIGCLVRCERFRWNGKRGEVGGIGDDDVSEREGW